LPQLILNGRLQLSVEESENHSRPRLYSGSGVFEYRRVQLFEAIPVPPLQRYLSNNAYDPGMRDGCDNAIPDPRSNAIVLRKHLPRRCHRDAVKLDPVRYKFEMGLPKIEIE
jgi:hypothetical protein